MVVKPGIIATSVGPFGAIAVGQAANAVRLQLGRERPGAATGWPVVAAGELGRAMQIGYRCRRFAYDRVGAAPGHEGAGAQRQPRGDEETSKRVTSVHDHFLFRLNQHSDWELKLKVRGMIGRCNTLTGFLVLC